MSDQQSAVHVIDDNAVLCGAIDMLLRSVGFRTYCHPSTESFLAEPLPDVPSCLLLDVRLQGASRLNFQTRLDPTAGDHHDGLWRRAHVRACDEGWGSVTGRIRAESDETSTRVNLAGTWCQNPAFGAASARPPAQ